MQTPRALDDMENGDVSVHGAAGDKSTKSNKFKTEAKENNGGKTSLPAQAATEVKSVRDANSARGKSFLQKNGRKQRLPHQKQNSVGTERRPG